MPTRLRKTRKRRGSRTCGWGQVGQHRKRGGRGGTGKAGLHKHKWSWTVKYAPNHFGGNVFRPPVTSRVRRWINIGDLDDLFRKSHVSGKKHDQKKPVVDLIQHGYDKLLGSGQVLGSYLVKTRSHTKNAKIKIEKAGGEIVVG